VYGAMEYGCEYRMKSKRVHETQSHATLALSSSYADSATRLPHLSIIRIQFLPHLTVHYRQAICS